MTEMRRDRQPDPNVVSVLKSLERYQADHPLAEVGVFKRRFDAIGVRIIDPDFRGMSLKERDDRVWSILEPSSPETERISVLLLMTPDEAQDSHFNTVAFDAERPDGPAQFLNGGVCFRREILGHAVFATVSRPLLPAADGGVEGKSDRYDAAFKLGFPPGILMTDDDQLSVDAGQKLRDGDYAPQWFDTVDAAKSAAFDAARDRLARLAAA